MKPSLIRSCALAALLGLSGCLSNEPELRPRVNAPSAPAAAAPTDQDNAPTEEASQREIPGQAAIFYMMSSTTGPRKALDVLAAHPALRMTLIFPAHYFDDPERAPFLDAFKVLQSSGQIEIALTLENEPMLPMLANIKVAGERAAKWGLEYAWPEDVAAQIARANGAYQKRWTQPPAGLYPPYLALSEPVVMAAKKFRLSWVMAAPHETWGQKEYESMTLLVPPIIPANDEATGAFAAMQKTAQWALSQPFVLINGSSWTTVGAEQMFFERLAAELAFRTEAKLITGRELAATLVDVPPLPENMYPFIYDYSAWVRSNRQKLGWQALAQARTVLRPFRDSGRATLQMLDAAYEELHMAQSGPFLLALGQPADAGTELNERNFLATLSNVYRLSGAPVPPNLNRWFNERGSTKAQAKSADHTRPFFTEGIQAMTWNDALGDDTGPGTYVYPNGRYAKGAFDLDQFRIRWTDDEMTFEVSLTGFDARRSASVAPLADIYIDVNRLADAGSGTPLKGRGNTVIQREAAWEYALAMGPGSQGFYQAVPGSTPRRLHGYKTEASSNTLSVSISRTELRGDPHHWRFTVTVMGMDTARSELAPLPSLAQPGPKNFGGAAGGREAPPFMDVLTPDAEDQTSRLQAYITGSRVTLPFVGIQ